MTRGLKPPVLYFLSKTNKINTWRSGDDLCVFNRLIDVGLEPTILSNRTPHLSRYWKKLKLRDSYKIGILDYYTQKEEKVLHEFHKNNDSSVLDKILKEMDLVEVNE